MIEKLTPERFVFKQGIRWGLLELQHILNGNYIKNKKDAVALIQGILNDLEIFMEYGSNIAMNLSPKGVKRPTCTITSPGNTFNTMKSAKALQLVLEILQEELRNKRS